MPENLSKRVRFQTSEEDLLPPGSHVLVAVSGGCDSVALLHVLAELAPALDLSLTTLHVDHGLRPEGPAEAAAVRRLSASLGLPCRTERLALSSGPDDRVSEERSREARRAVYVTAARAVGATLVATGHSRDDQAETVLMRLGRGTGLRGLRAIAPRSALAGDLALVRPLLRERRATLRGYAERHGLSWHEDPSNRSPDYLRNRVRHTLLPAFRESFGHDVVDRLAELAERARAEEDGVRALVAAAEGESWRRGSEGQLLVDVARLAPLPPALRRRALGELLRLWGLPTGVYAPHLEALADLAGQTDGSADLDLPGGARARRRYGEISLERAALVPPDGPADFLLVAGKVVGGAGLRLALAQAPRAPERLDGGAGAIWVDAAAGALRVRRPRPDDRMRLPGGSGHRLVRRILTDHKVARDLRGAARLLVDESDRPLWLLAPRGITETAAVLGPWEALARSGDGWVEPGEGPVLHVRLLADETAPAASPSLYGGTGAGMVSERE